MNKTLKIIFAIVAVIFVAVASFSGGLALGQFLPFLNSHGLITNGPAPMASTPSADQQASTPQDLQILFKPFWEAWNIIHEQYVDQPVNDVSLMQGAIRGMMESLGDPHSTYMDPATYKEANDQLAGSYEGIGAYVDTGGNYLTITSPIPGSPADKAGLRPGDQIIKIDGVDMTGVSPEVARQKVLGPAGSTVHLTVARSGQSAPLEFDITREKITVKSVTGKMLDNGIAYVQLTTFGDTTSQELDDTLKQLMAQNPKGLILDLRNNGGGYLNTAVDVASQFLDHGVVLYEQYGNGTKNTYNVEPGGLATKIPMVVLINEGTASASEIVSGALQDAQRATLVGVTSYGKGSVQNWIPLSNDQGAVRVTIARWLTPNGRTIDKKGLTPDVYVPMSEADYKAERDPQLDAAVETLTALINGTAIPTSAPTPTATPVP